MFFVWVLALWGSNKMSHERSLGGSSWCIFWSQSCSALRNAQCSCGKGNETREFCMAEICKNCLPLLRSRPRPINNRPPFLASYQNLFVRGSTRSSYVLFSESEGNLGPGACLPNLAEHFVSLLSFHFSGFLLTGRFIWIRTRNGSMVLERHISNSTRMQ